MATELKLPDLGEGVSDVTINRWRVKEGAPVKAGEVILEVATDKIDTEVPATVDGILLKINFREGELAPADAVIGMIGSAGESAAPATTAEPSKATNGKVEAAPKEPEATKPETTKPIAERSAETNVETSTDSKASPVAQRIATDKGVDLGTLTGTGRGGRITKEDVLSSANKDASAAPIVDAASADDASDKAVLEVQRLAADHNLDLRQIAQGRPLSSLTRYDLLSVIQGQPVAQRFIPAGENASPTAAKSATPVEAPKTASAPAALKGSEIKSTEIKATEIKSGEELVKHSRMRSAIARTTAASAFSAPHVTTMWDVEMTAVLAHRAAHKAEFGKAGVNLTVTAYLVEAIIAGLKAVPAANATWTDEGVVIKRYYNVGMAVALPIDPVGLGGLIVPVIKNAGDLNLQGLARAVNEMAEKARKNQLAASDLADGTFTLSNYGTSGSRFQTPIIVQPQVGILGVGVIEKRPIVVSVGHPLDANAGDYLTFRPMTTLGFSYDHRVLDGATADAFCAAVKAHLENYK